MGLLFRLLGVLVLSVPSIVGCAQVTDDGTAPLTFAVKSADAASEPFPALEGAQICEANKDNCVTTDATGAATLQLPVGRESAYTLEKEGHGSYLAAEVMPAGGEQYVRTMSTNGHLVDQFGRVMSAYPMRGTGAILIEVWPPFAGATFELADATGKAYYHDEEGRRSLDFTETTSQGTGGFVEVTPGEFTIKVGGTADQCVPGIGWPANEGNSVRFPVRENYMTLVSVLCAQRL